VGIIMPLMGVAQQDMWTQIRLHARFTHAGDTWPRLDIIVVCRGPDSWVEQLLDEQINGPRDGNRGCNQRTACYIVYSAD